ncbi:MAG: carbamoyltransferase HypF [Calditrichaeota bacterium]|nr:MAG: carbamoyltransferase HypF [Calditrichota bacterium]
MNFKKNNLNFSAPKTILGVGAELKNSLCLLHKNEAILSPNVGDLKTWETYEKFKEIAQELISIRKPDLIVHDLHPDYLSTRFALESNFPTIGVQHHKAHIASVACENDFRGKVIGIALDGTGFGEDNTVWGGEFFVGKVQNLERVARFKPIQLAGGDKAVEEIWRIGLAFLKEAEIDSSKFFKSVPESSKRFVNQMLDKNFNSIPTSSCGRLFDGVSAILGLCEKVTFEAEAAIKLEQIALPNENGFYTFDLEESGGLTELSFLQMFREIENDLSRKATSEISAKFHNTLALGIAKVVDRIVVATKIKTVALSGGCFQNKILFKKLTEILSKNYTVLTHSNVPTNDCGIALGQTFLMIND